jgi:hypothetical protein
MHREVCIHTYIHTHIPRLLSVPATSLCPSPYVACLLCRARWYRGRDGIMCIKDTYVVCKYVKKTLLELGFRHLPGRGVGLVRAVLRPAKVRQRVVGYIKRQY